MDLLKGCPNAIALPVLPMWGKARQGLGLTRVLDLPQKQDPYAPGLVLPRLGPVDPAGIRAVPMNNYIPNGHRLI